MLVVVVVAVATVVVAVAVVGGDGAAVVAFVRSHNRLFLRHFVNIYYHELFTWIFNALFMDITHK